MPFRYNQECAGQDPDGSQGSDNSAASPANAYRDQKCQRPDHRIDWCQMCEDVQGAAEVAAIGQDGTGR